MRTTRLAIVAAIAMAMAFSGQVAAKAVGPAGATETSCRAPLPAGSLTSAINLFGEDNLRGHDNADWNNGLFVCGQNGGIGNIPVLDNISQDANDDCKGFLGQDNNDFGDCFSSLKVDVNFSPAAVCVYTNTNYGGNSRKYNTDITDNSLDFTFDDAIDSIKWVGVTTAC
ncbi:MAG TPA: hypothetical protein VJ850_08180 [Candidatus Limnocylindrales bacterium]|nr:hypothetical protein [Candidatus Limnocylindrales bacterium]